MQRIDHFIQYINDSAIKEVLPTVLAWSGDSFIGVVPLTEFDITDLFTQVEQKDLHASAIREWLKATGATAFMMVQEAWMASAKTGEDLRNGPPPSKRPDRVEVVIVSYEAKGAPQLLRTYKLNRTPAGHIILDEYEEKSGQVTGRFTGLLPQ